MSFAVARALCQSYQNPALKADLRPGALPVDFLMTLIANLLSSGGYRACRGH